MHSLECPEALRAPTHGHTLCASMKTHCAPNAATAVSHCARVQPSTPCHSVSECSGVRGDDGDDGSDEDDGDDAGGDGAEGDMATGDGGDAADAFDDEAARRRRI